MFCFVILHYMALDETIKCCDSILNKVEGKKHIIIVDNGSNNGSGIKLQEKYQDCKNVTIILSKDNVGFANGNNLGYRYAKKNFNPDFIAILNNDIEIIQTDFIKIAKELYQQEHYAILGPDVYIPYINLHQNPKKTTSLTHEDILKDFKKYKSRKNSRIIVPIKCYLKNIKALKNKVQSNKNDKLNIDYTKTYYNVPLHGSCFIFSKKFIDARKDAFFSGTFMYYESEILDYECHKAGLKTMYSPKLKVNHNHNASTNLTYNSELKKARFINNCMYNSISAFLEILEKE